MLAQDFVKNFTFYFFKYLQKNMMPFFRRTGISVHVSRHFCRQFISHLGLILKLGDLESGCLFLEKTLKNFLIFFKIDLENSFLLISIGVV